MNTKRTKQPDIVFSPSDLLTTHREFTDMHGFVQAVHKLAVVWSWGARGWQRTNANCLRFRVRGHHHKGYVFLAPNASDLFDVWLTTIGHKIRGHFTDVHIDSLIDVLDERIERVPEYRF